MLAPFHGLRVYSFILKFKPPFLYWLTNFTSLSNALCMLNLIIKYLITQQNLDLILKIEQIKMNLSMLTQQLKRLTVYLEKSCNLRLNTLSNQ